MKFSIRDLLLVTVIVALAVGWWVEHRRREELENSIASNSKLSRLAIESLHDAIQRIESDLKHQGLTLVWSNDLRPSVEKIDLPNSSAPAPNPPKK